MGYQDIPRFSPSYGNRYGFRQKPAPSTVPFNQPVPDSPTASSSETRLNDYSGTSAESEGQTIDQGDGHSGPDAASYRDAASQDLGYERGRATPGQALAGLANVFGPPGLGSLVEYAVGDRLTGGIPEHERYGAAGTIGTEGGVFNAGGREIDPVTGQALNSYGNKADFYGGSYVSGIFNNPFSIDSYLGDPDNAYTSASFDPSDPYSAESQRGLQAQGFQQALQSGRGLLGGQDETGTGVTEEDRARVAQQLAVTDYGIQAHSAEAGSATNEAIQGRGYTGTGAAPAGSQFSSTGTFSSSHSDDGGDHGPGGNPNSVSDDVTDDLADEDFGSYDDGGGGGGGK